jgi:hypothetical protein
MRKLVGEETSQSGSVITTCAAAIRPGNRQSTPASTTMTRAVQYTGKARAIGHILFVRSCHESRHHYIVRPSAPLSQTMSSISYRPVLQHSYLAQFSAFQDVTSGRLISASDLAAFFVTRITDRTMVSAFFIVGHPSFRARQAVPGLNAYGG